MKLLPPARGEAGRPARVAFSLASEGEIQFFIDVYDEYRRQCPDDEVYVVHARDTIPTLSGRFEGAQHVSLTDAIHSCMWFDAYLVTEQFIGRLPNAYNICIFHGPSAKGVTFTDNILTLFDDFFLIGPLHKKTLEEFVHTRSRLKRRTFATHEVGYPKSDALLNGEYDRDTVLRHLGLDPAAPTVLYAPAFNDKGSLREFGVGIVDELCKLRDFNIICKLPIDCLEPTTDWRATGGVDWFDVLSKAEARHPNFRVFRDLKIDGALACSDVMITCVSSVGFEFFALRKPVVFIDTPRFFSEYLKELFPDQDTVAWQTHDTKNGGRRFGLVVSDIRELGEAVKRAKANPDQYTVTETDIDEVLLYNRGAGARKAVETVRELVAAGATNIYWRRLQRVTPVLAHNFWRSVANRLFSGYWYRTRYQKLVRALASQ